VRRESSGYQHPAYAASFDDIATPRELPACGAWILERHIAGSDLRDGMGCYPLFCCRDWTRLSHDVSLLAGQLVSFTLVTDPFGEFSLDDLRRGFDVVRPYKRHYVRDLVNDTSVPVTRRHKRNSASAMRAVTLDRVAEPTSLSDVWVELYEQLVERHRLTGLRAFSRQCLERQLSVPGLRMFSATVEGSVVGLHLWYVHGDVAYGHLGATNRLGYDLMASYALYAFAIEQLRPEVRWLALGSSSGDSDDNASDGLGRFKQGWATETRQVYLCGKVLQPETYNRLAGEARAEAEYFPAYRRGEFAPVEMVRGRPVSELEK
jgi:Acetyltransferase (GNAT) domain